MKTGADKKIVLRTRFRVMRGREIAFGPGKADLLRWVGETGSIREAAARMDMSYMRAWSLIRTMNECFKTPVIKAARGGIKHGGAELTPTGRRVLKIYLQMEADALAAMQPGWRALQRLLRG